MKRLAAFLIAMVAVAAQAKVIKCTNPKLGKSSIRTDSVKMAMLARL